MIKTIKNKMRKRREFIDLDRINFNVRHYKPKRNKIKLGVLISLVGVCLVTPLTNWVLIPVFKLLNKHPMWLYK